jgi:allophanate hydrolase subunit 1
MVRYNGLKDREELYESVLATEHWTAFIGFFPGLPFMFPLDPRHAVVAPKYNPTRVWTAEGALGLGGPCWAIYPVESAGGYQLVGRTLPIYDLAGRNDAFRENPLLLRAGDRVQFHRVDEDQLLALFEDVRADRYRYRIEEGTFDVGAFLRFRDEIADETDERRRRREEAAAATPVP